MCKYNDTNGSKHSSLVTNKLLNLTFCNQGTAACIVEVHTLFIHKQSIKV